MTYDEAEKFAESLGLDLAHNCDEKALECKCLDEGGNPDEHAPGDTRCESRAIHSACSHDLALLSDPALAGREQESA